MQYTHEFIAESDVPRASRPILQHLVDTYASETNKLAALWSELRDDQLEFRLHPRSSSVRQILTHQILSERRFFLGVIRPAGAPGCTLVAAGGGPPRPGPRGARGGGGPG